MASSASLLYGLLFGSIGLGYFIYGKKQNHLIALLAGIALMGYSYFISDIYWLLGIGIGLMLLPRLVRL